MDVEVRAGESAPIRGRLLSNSAMFRCGVRLEHKDPQFALGIVVGGESGVVIVCFVNSPLLECWVVDGWR